MPPRSARLRLWAASLGLMLALPAAVRDDMSACLKRIAASALSEISKHSAELAQAVVDAGAVAQLATSYDSAGINEVDARGTTGWAERTFPTVTK